jgi:hypothetical protein
MVRRVGLAERPVRSFHRAVWDRSSPVAALRPGRRLVAGGCRGVRGPHAGDQPLDPLRERPCGGAARWSFAHARHNGRVTPAPLEDHDPVVLELLRFAAETLLAHPDAAPGQLVTLLDTYTADLNHALGNTGRHPARP